MLVNVWFEFPDHHPASFQLIAYSAFLNPSLDSTITRTVTVLNTFTSRRLIPPHVMCVGGEPSRGTFSKL